MATAKQKAAARRNIKKAQAARKRKAAPKAARKAARKAAPKAAATKKRGRSVRARVISAVASRGKARSVKRYRMRPGVYISRKTGRKVRVTKNPIGRNTRDLMVAGLGLGLGLIGASILDRYVSTLPENGSNKPAVGTAAITKIQAKPTNARIAAQAIGTGAAGIGSFLLRKKSPTGAYLLGGVAVGFGVHLFQMVVDSMVMPALLEAKTPGEDSFANRIYPEFQTYGSSGTTSGPFAFRARRGQVGSPQVPQIGPIAQDSGTVGAGCSCDSVPVGWNGWPEWPYGNGTVPVPVPPDEPVAQPQVPDMKFPIAAEVPPGAPVSAVPTTFPQIERAGTPLANLIRLASKQWPSYLTPQGQPLGVR